MDTFRYWNPSTQQWEDRPLEPGIWDRINEGMFYTADVDKKRDHAKAMNYRPKDLREIVRDAQKSK